METITPLCVCAEKYGSDKCPQIGHFYTPVYYEMLKDKRETVKKVMELGIGFNDTMRHVASEGHYYITGASLRMWRDFFPNAQVYGMDIEPRCMFEDERITTFTGDSAKLKDWDRVLAVSGTDIDLFVDDGSHGKEHQLFVVNTLMPLFKKDVVYIIEDVRDCDWTVSQLPDYDCEIFRTPYEKPRRRMDNFIIVKRK